jgi:hypothetical protein
MSNSSDLTPTAERRGLPTPDRFEKLGYGPKHARKPLKELDLRSQLMLEYMICGTRHKHIADRIGVEVNEPMSQQQASDAVGFRRRNGRFVFSQAVFQKALSKGIEELRSGVRVKATLTQIELMNDRGDGSAAAGTLRLKASQALLGDGDGKGGVNVAVQVNTAIQLQPGIVIRLPADAAETPLELQANEIEGEIAAPIEHQDIQPEGLSIDPQAEATMRRNWPNTQSGE